MAIDHNISWLCLVKRVSGNASCCAATVPQALALQAAQQNIATELSAKAATAEDRVTDYRATGDEEAGQAVQQVVQQLRRDAAAAQKAAHEAAAAAVKSRQVGSRKICEE